jgi:hypothetical protein
MHLVQLFLPLYDNEGQAFARAMFDRVGDELTERYGGVTAYRRSPAEGLWKEQDGDLNRDDVVIYEVMAEEMDRAAWKRYGEELSRRFSQDEMMIRAIEVERL